MLMAARHSPALRMVFDQADLVTIESSGLSAASRLFGGAKVERLPGIDLAFQLCELAAKNHISVFLFGGKPGVPEEAAEFLSKKINGLQIAGTQNGYFTDNQRSNIANEITRSGAGLVMVALGMPRQELWISQYKNNLPGVLCIGVGGSFDVWSGRVKRAPEIFQMLGMEWFYRLLHEPSRIRRMLGLPLFALHALFERFFRSKSVE